MRPAVERVPRDLEHLPGGEFGGASDCYNLYEHLPSYRSLDRKAKRTGTRVIRSQSSIKSTESHTLAIHEISPLLIISKIW